MTPGKPSEPAPEPDDAGEKVTEVERRLRKRALRKPDGRYLILYEPLEPRERDG